MHDTVSPTMNMTGFVQWLHLASLTKDSINLEWHIDQANQMMVSGYKIRYQAMGSNVVQFSPMLGRTKRDYEIARLHEDTNYNICLEVYTNNMTTTEESIVHQCIKISTSTDSLTVALGSTFGAFLALGIIVMFVFLAKWQHQRRQQKQQLPTVAPSCESYDSMDQVDGDYEMSDVSLQVHEDTLKMEFSSQSSHGQSTTANGTLQLNIEPDIDEDEEYDSELELEGNVLVHEPPDSGQQSPITPESPQQLSTSSGENPISVAIGNGDSPTDMLLYPLSQSYSQIKDGRPPDVRPKDKALLDLTHMYANKKLFEQPQSHLRPNMSCNW